ncbi:hypothetical protein P154DRAFT_527050 [Amniculicola lignicola CBS 123094]|uniref:Uncharacterized protein n=1 Tax=Amniculicola lignicola CBS 123094 TaxID=1392246 RepID=A0A6A5VYK9_9PLEO|nr:hypothetical protein P154DRAFT_527050 [Amniculicola lignicola CBS 123094]
MERGEASDPPTLVCVPPLPHSDLDTAALETMSNSDIVNAFSVDIWRYMRRTLSADTITAWGRPNKAIGQTTGGIKLFLKSVLHIFSYFRERRVTYLLGDEG